MSEALALLAATAAINATHFFESGTYDGQSTEVMARAFVDAPLRITTIDAGLSRHRVDPQGAARFRETQARLRPWPSVSCLQGDAMKLAVDPRTAGRQPRDGLC